MSFAYPFGAFNATTEAVAKSCGYNNARTVADGPETVPPANAFATRAMPDIQVTAASGPAVTVAQMEGWVRAAEKAGSEAVSVIPQPMNTPSQAAAAMTSSTGPSPGHP